MRRRMSVAAIAAAACIWSVCVAFAQDGSIVAWGHNGWNQCEAPSPNTDFASVAAGGSHNVALKTDGSVVAWGRNDHGQCDVPEPPTDFVAVAAWLNHSLGLRTDSSVVAWGYNGSGQCDVPWPNMGFVAVAAGGNHSLGLKTDGSIVAWGYNVYGQCNVPAPNTGFAAVAAGGNHSIGLKTNGSVVAWGYNAQGQCNVPAPNADFVAVAAGHMHNLGLKADGSIVAWGLNNYGQCDVPSANVGFAAVAAGSLHSLGLKVDGSIVAWGWNDYGQCNVPAPNTGFTVLVAGGTHSVGVTVVLNQAPVAIAGSDQGIHAGQTVYLDGTASFDDNTPSENLGFAWTLTVRPEESAATLTDADTATPSFVADLPGIYAASLVVTDEAGLPSDPDTVEVSSQNMAPTANAGPDAAPIVGHVVELDGTGSVDPDDDLLAYAWSITVAPEGSAAGLTGETTAWPTFVPDLPGQYVVQLVVNDGFEDSAPDEVVISVITAGDFAEYNTADGLNAVMELPSVSVTTQGNQTALGNFLTQAITALQAEDTEEAINKLTKALSRTDGCVLRGEPDGPGPGRDWITDCTEQEVVYWLLKDALDAISP